MQNIPGPPIVPPHRSTNEPRCDVLLQLLPCQRRRSRDGPTARHEQQSHRPPKPSLKGSPPQQARVPETSRDREVSGPSCQALKSSSTSQDLTSVSPPACQLQRSAFGLVAVYTSHNICGFPVGRPRHSLQRVRKHRPPSQATAKETSALSLSRKNNGRPFSSRVLCYGICSISPRGSGHYIPATKSNNQSDVLSGV